MEDDIVFGASIWGSSDFLQENSDPSRPTSVNFSPSSTTGAPQSFDESDDFAYTTSARDDPDDDFGEFADFGESEPSAFNSFVQTNVPASSSTARWEPLSLHPAPSRFELEEQIYHILEPCWNEKLEDVTTNDDIREVEGIGQILMTSSSRDLYKMLLMTPPLTRLPNWTSSRIRRQHLVALGIPVNLDEMLPRAKSKLPTLAVRTRPMSAPPGPNHLPPNHSTSGMRQASRANSPQSTAPKIFKPTLNMDKINKLLELDPEMLPIEPLKALENILADLKVQTANTSDLLTHLLQEKDAFQQNSETYNCLIAELVVEAQKKSAAKPRTAPIKRSTVVG